MDAVEVRANAPPVWVLVFCRDTESWWVRRLAAGTYKHVKAYAYLPGRSLWIFYEVGILRTDIQVLPDEAAVAHLAEFTRNADMIAMPVRDGAPLRLCRLGFCCVSACKHLIGLRSSALRPDSLWRDCLRNGGEPFERPHGRYVTIGAATRDRAGAAIPTASA